MSKGSRTAAALALTALVATVPISAAGFSIYEQGSRAMGMAGAFTAQADDPSLLFHNVGGLAFVDEQEFSAGFTYITISESELTGANPFPGEGARGAQKTLAEFPPHFYWVRPIGDAWSFGLAVNAPFGLTTEWEDPFVGRFISTKAVLKGIDLSPNVGFKLTDNFGVGIGAIVRFSEVELNTVQPAINPFTQLPVDISNNVLESDFHEGYGWQIGVLHKVNNSFSWGFAYRGKIEIDYSGSANFNQILTGNPVFDAIVAGQLPAASVPITTTIEFPDAATFGIAIALSGSTLLEIDANWTGWSSFDTIVANFEGGVLPPLVRPQNWEDVNNYRIGLLFGRGSDREWRFGYVYDENPIPDSTLGPLLPDADRNGFTIGYGRKGAKRALDLALMYLPFDDRTVSTNIDDFNGSYKTTAWLLGTTVSW